MNRLLVYIITVLMLTALLLYISFNYMNKRIEYKRIKQNIELKEIYIDDNEYINKLENQKKQLEEELYKRYETLNEEELQNIIKKINSDNDNNTKYISNKNEEKSKLNNQIKELNAQYIALKNKKESENKINNNTTSYMINNIKTLNQYPKYPTGCESVALDILLSYYNVNITVDEIIKELPKGKLPYYENSILYGGNPNMEFIGDPYNSTSYGVYDYPISLVANKYKETINNGTGKSLSELLEITKQNKPVLVWTSMNLALPYISSSWIYKPTGEKINWIANEHAVVLIGEQNNKVIISDPIGGTIKYQDKNLFEQRYNYYGKRNLYY